MKDNLLDPQRTIVRVNPGRDARTSHSTSTRSTDTPYSLVMLAKTESAEHVDALTGRSVIALCETAKGVVQSATIAAAAGTVALMWGAEDLVASLGGKASRHDDGTYREFARFARSQVLLSARAYGRVGDRRDSPRHR